MEKTKGMSPENRLNAAERMRRRWVEHRQEQLEAVKKGAQRLMELYPNRMSQLGKIGGAKLSQDREHMAKIGSIGGSKRARNRKKRNPHGNR